MGSAIPDRRQQWCTMGSFGWHLALAFQQDKSSWPNSRAQPDLSCEIPRYNKASPITQTTSEISNLADAQHLDCRWSSSEAPHFNQTCPTPKISGSPERYRPIWQQQKRSDGINYQPELRCEEDPDQGRRGLSEGWECDCKRSILLEFAWPIKNSLKERPKEQLGNASPEACKCQERGAKRVSSAR